ncbi:MULTISPECIES: hypothetical protein [Sphaerospermopsis]|uniref:Uncharacterized protein n=1 Tax=Sphaerospermopsis reniformis TaxID=531300 RepID=A0A479ZZH6_9CYAN|nr:MULTISPECIES: hypothetical protein [Sphaerospermopsis]MBD2131345.1 hypothetical protein [Sphaerospermopsis sp. FACHB-1094]MBD2146928.1 hypothetical protein [Sphaerospermopsis sp. FACHB-1194]GCL38049.1 hypothetical protein SR1949_31620 [Sphaerospermopsis reniformis]
MIEIWGLGTGEEAGEQRAGGSYLYFSQSPVTNHQSPVPNDTKCKT